ncbi:hypothetical protein AB3N59_18400 [Leptospira sp. WS92.C1]
MKRLETDPWKQPSDGSVREAAEKNGKLILFVLEPEACVNCHEIREALESFKDIQDQYLFFSIGEKKPGGNYEGILLDDRFAEAIPAMAEKRGAWGVFNSSDEVLLLLNGIPRERENTILFNLAEKNRFRFKKTKTSP